MSTGDAGAFVDLGWHHWGKGETYLCRKCKKVLKFQLHTINWEFWDLVETMTIN